MNTFTINKDYSDESTVQADEYMEEGALVTFFNQASQRVASFATSKIRSVHREESK